MAAPVRLTRDEIRRQQEGSTRIAPGIWVDRDGHVHWSIIEILAMVDLDDTPENREAVARIAEEVAREHGITAIRQEPE